MIDVDVMQGYVRDANPIPTLDDLDPNELTTFVTAAWTRRAAVMQAPTQHPTAPTTPTPPPQRSRKAWAFAAGFVVILLVVGAAALFLRGGDTPVADEPMAPVTVTERPLTTSAPDPIDVEALTWSRVPHDEAVFNPTTGQDVMRDITVGGGPGFVAVGEISAVGAPAGGDGSFDVSNDAGVWVSEDGISWSLVTSVEPHLAGPHPMDEDPLRTGLAPQWMESVTPGGPGLVAVGLDDNAEGYGFAGAAWTSEDGITWSKASVESGSSLMEDVAAGGPGLVAVGDVRVEDSSGAAAYLGAIWTSVDGVTWNRVIQDPGVDGRAFSVTVGGPGLVAVGVDWGWTDGPPNAAVWTSPDGLIWTSVPSTEIPGRGVMFDVVAGGPGLVAVGADDNGGAAVWTSPDGFTWTRAPLDPKIFDTGPLNAVTSVGSQLVAVNGNRERLGSIRTPDDGVIFVWTSDDGVTWTRTEIPGGGTMHSVAVTDSGLIAVGEHGGAAAVWIATEG